MFLITPYTLSFLSFIKKKRGSGGRGGAVEYFWLRETLFLSKIIKRDHVMRIEVYEAL